MSSTYQAPIADLQFVLSELLGPRALAGCRGFEDYSPELMENVLGEAGRFAEEVLDPINRPGDEHGAKWSAEGVTTAPGFREAYRQFAAAGWPQLGASPEYGGQAAPRVLTTAVQEIWAAANLAFKLCPMLTHGATHALELTGSAE